MFNRKEEIGQGLVEYALLLMLVAMVVLLILVVFGLGVSNTYDNGILQPLQNIF
jgi:Flp pilus assembly pilin Flp